MIGETISHYRIAAKLGAGGMGEVYLADDTRLERQVALKFLPPAVRDNAEAKQRLMREAKAASKLDHPNIVTIHGIEESDGRLFIVMAHVNGANLDKYLTSMGREPGTVIKLALQILDGLGNAHDRGVIHRDLKPGNILVDERGHIRILDFGLARMNGAERLTQVGSTVGTLAYSPPEIVLGEDATALSDIYSFGVVLYQMLTGDLPFESAHEAALLYSILNENPRPLQDSDPTIPIPLQKVVLRCLDKQPRQRYQNCADVGQALRTTLQSSKTETKLDSTADIPSIAVLPFVNRSRSEDDEYFADGLADELLNLLAKIRGLRVAAQTSTFQFKGKSEDLKIIGQKLNVATLLEGSVRKSGNRVRISVQLVKVSDGYHLWSESYDRTLDDIFEVQDDIAQCVVKELRTTLLGEEENSNTSRELKAEVARAAKGRAHNAEAQRLFMLAKHLIDRRSREDVARGLEYLNESLALDPEYALAWTALGDVYAFQAGEAVLPVDEGYGKAREAAERALALEPELAEAHATLGFVRMMYDWDWSGADESYRRALELAPGNASALSAAAMLARDQQHPERSIALARQALEQDPLSATAHTRMGVCLFSAGRVAEAKSVLSKSLELSPSGLLARTYLARIFFIEDDVEEAFRVLAAEPDEVYRLQGTAVLNHLAGRSAESQAALDTILEKYATDSAYQIAEVYGARGESDAAFEWLERAYAQRDPGLTNVKSSFDLKSLHDDPRWPVFMKKMGFEDERYPAPPLES